MPKQLDVHDLHMNTQTTGTGSGWKRAPAVATLSITPITTPTREHPQRRRVEPPHWSRLTMMRSLHHLQLCCVLYVIVLKSCFLYVIGLKSFSLCVNAGSTPNVFSSPGLSAEASSSGPPSATMPVLTSPGAGQSLCFCVVPFCFFLSLLLVQGGQGV